jgi:hypothetical protein
MNLREAALISLATGFCGFALAAPVTREIPQFPKVRYSPNVIYRSEGFRLGYIQTFARVGYFPWSYEFQMALGVGTSSDQSCIDEEKAEAQHIPDLAERQRRLSQIPQNCLVDSNPWLFSSLDTPIYNQIDGMMQTVRPVVIYYSTPVISYKQLVTRTSNYVYDIFTVDERYPVQKYFEISLPLAAQINPERGTIVGRVVKASLDHLFFKTYEITIQKNVQGMRLIKMSLNDSNLFDQVVRAMLTGKVLRIGYIRLPGWYGKFLSVLRGYDTNSRIVSVDILEPSQISGSGNIFP